VTGPSRDALLAAYVPLCTCLPRAFDIEGERDRREPLVVRALLEQVAGLDTLMIDKMMGAGLGRLAPLYAARADEIAAVTAIPDDIAAATAARVQAFHRATPAALATVDPAATVRELAVLVERLRTEHAAFEDAARGWSEADRLSKKRLRWVRRCRSCRSRSRWCGWETSTWPCACPSWRLRAASTSWIDREPGRSRAESSQRQRHGERPASRSGLIQKETNTIMGELTRDQVLQKVRKNEKLERADLRGLDLSKAALSGAMLSRADIEGANLERRFCARSTSRTPACARRTSPAPTCRRPTSRMRIWRGRSSTEPTSRAPTSRARTWKAPAWWAPTCRARACPWRR